MSVLVLAEHDNKELNPAVLNAVTAAKALGEDVDLLVLGKDCAGVAEAAARVEGVARVHPICLAATLPSLAKQGRASPGR
jgi:electron transfer flavoprotein alpha subunit